MGCPDGGRKNPAIADPTLALLRQGFFLIKIREKIYWGMTSFNRIRWLCSAGGSFLE